MGDFSPDAVTLAHPASQLLSDCLGRLSAVVAGGGGSDGAHVYGHTAGTARHCGGWPSLSFLFLFSLSVVKSGLPSVFWNPSRCPFPAALSPLRFPAEGEHLTCPGNPGAHHVPHQSENVLNKCELGELTKRTRSPTGHLLGCCAGACVGGTHLRPLRPPFVTFTTLLGRVSQVPGAMPSGWRTLFPWSSTARDVGVSVKPGRK